jgi:hypothetical protein
MADIELSKEALWKAVKEPLRLLLFALIPFALAYLKTFPTGWATALTLLLRFFDKLLHEIGKETDNKLLVKGLSRF